MELFVLYGTAFLVSILGPMAARYRRRGTQVGPIIRPALIAPALFLMAAAYVYFTGSGGEPEEAAVFGIVFAATSFLIGMLAAALVIRMSAATAAGDFQQLRRAVGEQLPSRMLRGGWITSVVGLAFALFYLFASR